MSRVEFSKIGKRNVTFIREMRVRTLKSLINEQGGLVLRITLKRACSFIRDFRITSRLYFIIPSVNFSTFGYLQQDNSNVKSIQLEK